MTALVTCLLALFGAIPLFGNHAAATPLVGAYETRAASTPRDTVAWLDPIERLQQQLDSGTVTLERDSLLGYLPALLRALDIPVASQGLVFSRTSLQTDRIAPWAPRALYFNDDVYIGYVLESTFLEIAAVHPTEGAVFYTLSQSERPRLLFEREGRTCLMCHQSRTITGGVPGFMVLSTLADRYGYPIAGVQDGAMNDATPLAQRWGGWYVTGSHGAAVPAVDSRDVRPAPAAGGHAGNVYSPDLVHEIPDRKRYQAQFDFAEHSSLRDVRGMIDTSLYLSAHSDIVALSVLLHQTVVHNLITALHEAARGLPAAVGAAADAGPAASPELVRVQGAARRLADAMLFSDEAPLAGPLRGTTSFAETFSQRGPRDGRGRSLRDFDLEQRLFRYPLSFLVYSDSFRALPDVAKRLVFARLAMALNGLLPDQSATAPLGADARIAIREILLETLPADEQAMLRAVGGW